MQTPAPLTPRALALYLAPAHFALAFATLTLFAGIRPVDTLGLRVFVSALVATGLSCVPAARAADPTTSLERVALDCVVYGWVTTVISSCIILGVDRWSMVLFIVPLGFPVQLPFSSVYAMLLVPVASHVRRMEEHPTLDRSPRLALILSAHGLATAAFATLLGILGDHSQPFAAGLVVSGAAWFARICAVGGATALALIARRHLWLWRVRRGDIPAWRIRPRAALPETHVSHLPHLLGGSLDHVLLRRSNEGSPYRDASDETPVALV